MAKYRSLPLLVLSGVVVVIVATAGIAVASDRSVAFLGAIDPPSTPSFDISWVDNSTGKYFLADRSNKAIDLVDATATNLSTAFKGFIGQGVFVGSVATANCTGGPNVCSGPDGVLTDNAGLVWAGDGNSTIKVLNPTPNTGAAALIKSIPTCPTSEADCGTGGKFRADEESLDPVHHVILIANDAEGFLTFVHVDDTNPSASSVVGHFFYADNTLGAKASVAGHSTAGNGIEQSVWVPQTGLFYQAVPGCTPPACTPAATGFIDVFDPTTMKLVDTFPVAGCDNGPTGLALGPNQRFLGACGNGAAAIEVRHGQVHSIVSGVAGADEIWFNPGDSNFYLGIGSGALGVVDANNDRVVTVISGKGGHSVAAYAGNNHIFDPDRTGAGIDTFDSSGSR